VNTIDEKKAWEARRKARWAIRTEFRKYVMEVLNCHREREAMDVIQRIDTDLGMEGGSDLEIIEECPPTDFINSMIRVYIIDAITRVAMQVREGETDIGIREGLVQQLSVVWSVSRVPGCDREQLWRGIEDALDELFSPKNEDVKLNR